MSIDDHLTLSQASSQSGRSKRELRSLAHSGKLPAIRRGKRWLVSRADLVSLGQPVATVQVAGIEKPPATELDGRESSTAHANFLMLLEMLRDRDEQIARLQEDRVRLSGQVGYLQAQVSDRDNRLKLLEGATIEGTSRRMLVESAETPAPSSGDAVVSHTRSASHVPMNGNVTATEPERQDSAHPAAPEPGMQPANDAERGSAAAAAGAPVEAAGATGSRTSGVVAPGSDLTGSPADAQLSETGPAKPEGCAEQSHVAPVSPGPHGAGRPEFTIAATGAPAANDRASAETQPAPDSGELIVAVAHGPRAEATRAHAQPATETEAPIPATMAAAASAQPVSTPVPPSAESSTAELPFHAPSSAAEGTDRGFGGPLLGWLDPAMRRKLHGQALERVETIRRFFRRER